MCLISTILPSSPLHLYAHHPSRPRLFMVEILRSSRGCPIALLSPTCPMPGPHSPLGHLHTLARHADAPNCKSAIFYIFAPEVSAEPTALADRIHKGFLLSLFNGKFERGTSFIVGDFGTSLIGLLFVREC